MKMAPAERIDADFRKSLLVGFMVVLVLGLVGLKVEKQIYKVDRNGMENLSFNIQSLNTLLVMFRIAPFAVTDLTA